MDMDSCTKKTTYATGKWLGNGEHFTVSNFMSTEQLLVCSHPTLCLYLTFSSFQKYSQVVDTPGLLDSDGQDTELIRGMIDVLKNKVKTVNCIVLLIEAKTERLLYLICRKVLNK